MSTESTYSTNWTEWIKIADAQAQKDDFLFPQMMKWFIKEGNVLEIGAGVGQLSILAKNAGFDVVASDLEPKFVEYMISKGLDARVIDILNMSNAKSFERWQTIFTQGASPFWVKDESILRSAYLSVFESLENGGRFIILVSRTPRNKTYSRLSDHIEIIQETGFKLIHKTRNQVFPSKYYGSNLLRSLENKFGNKFGIRDLFVLEK